MRAKLNLGIKEYELKSSAATPILYKNLFKKDLLIELKSLSELKSADQIEMVSGSTEIFLQLTYIMYLEANYKVDEIWRMLSNEKYFAFLMSFDNTNDILLKSKEIIAIYTGNSKTLSDSKNE